MIISDVKRKWSVKMTSKISVVMPSYNNEMMKKQALLTLTHNTRVPLDIYQYPEKKNYGWMGGCNMGIKASVEHEYILFANDDILVPGICDWAKNMLTAMEGNKHIGALSVLTMNAMGASRLCVDNCVLKGTLEVPFCSFFFVLMRNEAVKKAGLFDEDLPGGDDLDYCMRLRDAGYRIGITPNVFVWHHYAQTGKRLFGDWWDCQEYTDNINHALIKKHGFKKYIYSKFLGDR